MLHWIYTAAALAVGIGFGVGLARLYFLPKVRQLEARIEYENQREDAYWREHDAEMNFHMEVTLPKLHERSPMQTLH